MVFSITHRTYLKCDVCGSIILVRTQVGWLSSHPIRIYCAKCGILISGTFSQDVSIPKFIIDFKNAEEVQVQEPDYYIEVSGELLTSKIRPYLIDEDEFQLPPFFKAFNAMAGFTQRNDNGDNAFLRFNRDYLQFLEFSEKEWPYLRRLHEIWLNGNHEFLAAQMRDRLPADIFPLNNELEYLRGIHQLFLIGFRQVLPKDFYDVTAKMIMEQISHLGKANPNGYVKLTEFFDNSCLLKGYEKRIFKILNGFVEKYPFFITTIGLQSYTDIHNLDADGITSVSFENLKHYYLDCFEAIGELITLVMAYNNLAYRNDFSVMADSTFPNVKTLDDFIEIRNKGNKIKFCETDEVFNHIISLDTDNGLRNAIGHDSYSYDGVNQVIKYYSSGVVDKGDSRSLFLVEFIQKILSFFYSIIALNELVYQTRKFSYVQHGVIPINPNVFIKNKRTKIERNEPCFCESGKKYKRCCGLKD